MISIITAVFNKKDLTRRFWKSLRRFPPSCDWQIIWVDDGSSDGTSKWLREIEGGDCVVISNDKNSGFAYSNNVAARIADGDILLFLNNDTVLTKGWLDPMLESLCSEKGIGVVGNIQLGVDTGRIDHAGICYDLIGRPEHYLKGRALSAARGDGRFSSAVTAACCMIRRDLFLSVGGFDEAFRNGCEDIDLCLRLSQMGYRHWVDYRSVIYHHVSASPGRKDHEDRNLALFLKRWGHLTSKWGQEDWPRNYLSRHLRCPWRLNGAKTVDAALRLSHLRHGDSKWAAKRRAELIALAETGEHAAG